MATYRVIYCGGESRKEAHRACDFMLVNLDDGDELYAERVYPSGVEGDSPEFNHLEEQYEEELRAEIIEQAAQRGIDSAQLVF